MLSITRREKFGSIGQAMNGTDAFWLKETELLVLVRQIRFLQPEIFFPLAKARLFCSLSDWFSQAFFSV